MVFYLYQAVILTNIGRDYATEPARRYSPRTYTNR